MAEAPQQNRWQGRPRSVTFVGWGVFLLGLANGWRALGLFRQYSLLLDFNVSPDPRLQLIVSFFWAGIYVLLALTLWRRRGFVRLAIPLSLVVYGLYQLGLKAIFSVNPQPNSSFFFAAGLYTAAILFSTWALNRRTARNYFEDKHG